MDVGPPVDSGFDALVPAGGAARRLGGADKPGLDVGGATLLQRVVQAVAGARRIVVVGPPRPLQTPVRWAREDPPGGGPVAAIAAGLAQITAPNVLVLAADLPWVAPAVPALLAALPGHDAALLADDSGRANLLAAAWRTASLAAAVTRVGTPAGAPVRALLAGADVRLVPDPAGWGGDCDTWADVAAARARQR